MANPENRFAFVSDWERRYKQTGWWHSFELPNGRQIEGASAVASQQMRIRQFPIPDDLSGKRVLDVGTWDGWFAFEMERRGAEVMAIDRWRNPRFAEIHAHLHSNVDYRQVSVYDLDPSSVGRFDIVLFMGVLYHLKHPLAALERICAIAKDFVAIESFILQDRYCTGCDVEERALMEFYEYDEFGGQFDTWFAPTVQCLLALCRTAGFARAEFNNVHEFGAAVSCYRTWPASAAPVPAQQPLRLLSAVHAENFGLNFRSGSDEYVTCHVVAEALELTRANVMPEVGDYGAPPVFVGLIEDCWQVNFMLPPGLSAGWHQVRLRTTQGATSNAIDIAVNLTPVATSLEVRGASDGLSWERSRVYRGPGLVSVWVAGLPKNADVANVTIKIGPYRLTTTYVGPPDTDGVSQVNARMTEEVPLGRQELFLQFEGLEAPPTDIEVANR